MISTDSVSTANMQDPLSSVNRGVAVHTISTQDIARSAGLLFSWVWTSLQIHSHFSVSLSNVKISILLFLCASVWENPRA